MTLFGNGAHGVKLDSILKALERHASEHTRRADHFEQDLKALETGLRADLQAQTAALARIEAALKARNGGKAAAAVKKTAGPAGYAGGGAGLLYLIHQLIGG